MTPFMRKYASGGVVRMQDGGMTPHDMAQMDAQMMSQKYPFLSGSKDQVLQGLSSVDPSDFSYISSMFNNSPEIDAVLNSLQPTPDPVSFDQSMLDTMDNRMPLPPMVENITPQSTLMLDGVMTTTPDGQRPYAPNTPSIDSLDQFANAFREDAARAENLLATLDDSTAKEKEAISNPVNVNLPKIRTLEEIGRDAPQGFKGTGVKLASLQDREDFKYDPSSFGAMFDGSSREFPSRAKRVIGSNLSDLGSFLSDQFQDVKSSSGSSINRGFNYLSGGADEVEREREDISPYSLNSGLDASQGIFPINSSDSSIAEEQNAYLENLGKRNLDAANRYKQKRESAEDLINVANSQLQENVVSDTVISDGATFEGSGDKGVNNSNKAVNLLNNAFELDLDATKKEAFAMAMIQLGAGIAKGDLAEGLSNAGVAASGVMESARDRSDKQLDREIQRKYYADKLSDSRLDRQSRIRRDAGTSALKKYTAQATAPLNLAKFAKMSQAEKDQLYDTIFQEELRVLTQSATGSDMRRGGSESESLNEDPLGLRKT